MEKAAKTMERKISNTPVLLGTAGGSAGTENGGRGGGCGGGSGGGGCGGSAGGAMDAKVLAGAGSVSTSRLASTATGVGRGTMTAAGGGGGHQSTLHGRLQYTSQLAQLFSRLLVPHSPLPSHKAPMLAFEQVASVSKAAYEGQCAGDTTVVQHSDEAMASSSSSRTEASIGYHHLHSGCPS